MTDETAGTASARETLASLLVPNTTWRALPDDVRAEVTASVPTQVRAIRRALGGGRRIRRIDDRQQQRVERLARESADLRAAGPSDEVTSTTESES
jgi:hypothetical protein